MSHIDKALRAWEDASGVRRADVEVRRSPARGALNTFGREELPARGAAPASGQPIALATPAPASAPAPTFAPALAPRFRIKPREAASLADADLQARLVTGGLDAMGLEQYRRMAAALHDAQAEAGLKTVMLTSALPNEGKTLTTVNLALTLSTAFGLRVLIIDADLRRPGVHTLFGLPNTRGLTEALADDLAEPAFVQASDGLSLLTAGRPGPTPLAGLSSPRMGTLLEQCARQFDWVLIDTPPVGLLPDAHVLARLAGAVILIIGAGSTPSAAIERVAADLGPECIIGTVLNRVEHHRIANSGYYGRYNQTDDKD